MSATSSAGGENSRFWKYMECDSLVFWWCLIISYKYLHVVLCIELQGLTDTIWEVFVTSVVRTVVVCRK